MHGSKPEITNTISRIIQDNAGDLGIEGGTASFYALLDYLVEYSFLIQNADGGNIDFSEISRSRNLDDIQDLETVLESGRSLVRTAISLVKDRD